jgi:hypothetical protein
VTWHWYCFNWLDEEGNGVFGYLKQSTTVSVGSVLKWRARSRRHAVNWAEDVIDEHPMCVFWYCLNWLDEEGMTVWLLHCNGLVHSGQQTNYFSTIRTLKNGTKNVKKCEKIINLEINRKLHLFGAAFLLLICMFLAIFGANVWPPLLNSQYFCHILPRNKKLFDNY